MKVRAGSGSMVDEKDDDSAMPGRLEGTLGMLLMMLNVIDVQVWSVVGMVGAWQAAVSTAAV